MFFLLPILSTLDVFCKAAICFSFPFFFSLPRPWSWPDFANHLHCERGRKCWNHVHDHLVLVPYSLRVLSVRFLGTLPRGPLRPGNIEHGQSVEDQLSEERRTAQKVMVAAGRDKSTESRPPPSRASRGSRCPRRGQVVHQLATTIRTLVGYFPEIKDAS